ncbi:hypothetical protein DAERI_180053 [Deinococcus aerius]|uniref:Uncharacterized protein n=1 Tax=Deinococcus aerius TaxID=200253 RepID=A0A2I9D031_9DEIO|nr:hypothetical protein DAERI_180053 [Deinococcus aerius]
MLACRLELPLEAQATREIDVRRLIALRHSRQEKPSGIQNVTEIQVADPGPAVILGARPLQGCEELNSPSIVTR